MKLNGKPHIVTEKKLCGLSLWKTAEPKPTAIESFQRTWQSPLKWMIYITLPVGILGVAVAFWSANPVVARRATQAACIALTAAPIAAALYILSLWPLIFIPIAIITAIVVYKKTKGMRGLKPS
jgi:hypothetical protein